MKPIKYISEGKPSGKPKKDGGKPGGKPTTEPSFSKCKSDLNALASDGWSRQPEENYNKASEKIYDKKTYLCKANNSTSYHIKRKEVTSNTDDTITPVSQTYNDCTTGPFVKGCKDPGSSKGSPNVNGSIYKLQGCLGSKQDSYFGSNTESALKLKTGKTSATKEEIESICSSSPVTPGGGLKFGPEEQKEWWKTLMKNGQITNLGALKFIPKTQTFVYVIKYDKNESKVELTPQEIDTTSESGIQKLVNDFKNGDYYVVLYPIHPQGKAKKGEVGYLTAGLDNNQKTIIKLIKDPKSDWQPTEEESTFDDSYETMSESVVKKVLNLRLFEQNISRMPPKSSSDPMSDTKPQGTTPTPTPTPKKDEVVINPEVKKFVESKGYTFVEPSLDKPELLGTKTTVGEFFKSLEQYGGSVYEKHYGNTTPIWKASYSESEKVDVDNIINTAKSADTRPEVKRKACKSAVKQLYYRAFKSERIIQFKDLEGLDSNTLTKLKETVIKCDEDKNFVEGEFGIRDELKSLYRCYQTTDKKRSKVGIDKFCLKDYMKTIQKTPGMQLESIVKNTISEAIQSKKKKTMVESILKKIKGTD
jgi:hypothetical protein